MTDVALKSMDAPPSWERFLPTPARVRLAIVVALLALIYWPTVRHLMIAEWIHDADWSHGWLIPVFSGYFLYAHCDELRRVVLRGSATGAIVLTLSLAAFFTSAWWGRWGYVQAVTVVSSILGLTLLMGGWGLLRVTWFPIVFLALAVPLPDRLYVELTFPLRQFASAAAAALMPLLTPGLHTEAQAVVIDYVLPGRPPGQLNVEEACAGMRLMMAFVTLGVAMAYLGERPGWQRLVMVLGCVPIAVFCNVVRVTTTGLLHIHGFESWARGTPHELLGLAMLLLAMLLYIALGWLLNRLFIEEAASGESPAPRKTAG